MNLKTSKITLSIAVGAAFGASLAFSPLALADTNPFGASELSGGYMQIAGGDKAQSDRTSVDYPNSVYNGVAHGGCRRCPSPAPAGTFLPGAGAAQ